MAKKPRSNLFSRFSLAWTRVFATSVFARFLALYGEWNEGLSQGIFAPFARFFASKKYLFLKFKGGFARQVENSTLSRLCRRYTTFFATLRLKSVGLFFFVFGICNCLIFLSRRFLSLFGEAESSQLLFGLFATLASLPLFSRRRSLSVAVKKSRILGALFSEVALLRAEDFSRAHSHSADALTAFLGFGAGALSLFVNPFFILLAVFAVVLCALSLYKPEFGAALTLFCLPFVPQNVAAMLTVFVGACLLFKMLRGRRSATFDLLTLVSLILATVVLFCALSSRLACREQGLLLLMGILCFFIFANLSRRRAVFTVLIGAFVAGTASLAAINTLFRFLPEQFVTGALRGFYLTLTANASPAVALCGAILSLYLVLRAKTGAHKLFSFVALLLLILDHWISASLSTALSLMISAAVLLCVSSRALFFCILALGIGTLVCLPFIEGSQLAFLFDAFASSAGTPLFSVSGLPGGSFVFGIGAFCPESLSAFGLQGEVLQSLSLYTQLLLSVGLFGLFVFGVFFLFSFQKAMHFYAAATYNQNRLMALAPLIASLALLICGLRLDLMADARTFILLFSFAAISSATVDTLKNEDAVILNRF